MTDHGDPLAPRVHGDPVAPRVRSDPVAPRVGSDPPRVGSAPPRVGGAPPGGSESRRGFATKAIHAGYRPDPATGAVNPPIYASSTFAQDGVGGLRGGFEYARTGNPTRAALETALAAVEDGRYGRAFGSGMAASDCALRTVLRPGDHLVIPD